MVVHFSPKVHRGVLPAALQDLHGALHPRRPRNVLHRARRLLRSPTQPPQVRRGRGEYQPECLLVCDSPHSANNHPKLDSERDRSLYIQYNVPQSSKRRTL